MQSTMQDFPLTLTGILRHGTGWNSNRRVTTATAGGYRDISYGELGARVAQLAHGLRQLGVSEGDRVATFMWNNQEHLEAYFAAPCMGAVLHTLNIRLSGEQIAFIANEAEDRVVLVDMSLTPLLAPVLAEMDSVQTVVVVGEGDLTPLTGAGKSVLCYDELLDGQPV
jgi:fatty-acyl-CoA synthase